MKKYYLHNGNDQQGPFDFEELKQKGLLKQTPIWYEGLSVWTTAGEIDELKGLFNNKMPPPFNSEKSTPPPFQKPPIKQSANFQTPIPKKSNPGRSILIGVLLLFLVIGGILVANKIYTNSTGGIGGTGESYQEKVMTVEEIEHSQPTSFLTADGKYNQNFWGTKIKVHGVIKNTATVASFKDAIVRVTYYSKTKTELGRKEYTIYENFPPHSEVKFELIIDNYQEVNTINWDVIQAIAN